MHSTPKINLTTLLIIVDVVVKVMTGEEDLDEDRDEDWEEEEPEVIEEVEATTQYQQTGVVVAVRIPAEALVYASSGSEDTAS